MALMCHLTIRIADTGRSAWPKTKFGFRLIDGSFQILYEYDMYYFNDAEYLTTARSYADTPSEASFQSLEFKGENRFLEESDFQLPILRIAIEYLTVIGKLEIMWLSRNDGGYCLVPKSV